MTGAQRVAATVEMTAAVVVEMRIILDEVLGRGWVFGFRSWAVAYYGAAMRVVPHRCYGLVGRH